MRRFLQSLLKSPTAQYIKRQCSFLCQGLRNNFQLAPYATKLLLAVGAYALLLSLLHEQALPRRTDCLSDSLNSTVVSENVTQTTGDEECNRGTVFGLYLILTLGFACGTLSQWARLPPLFGAFLRVISKRTQAIQLRSTALRHSAT